MIYVQYLLLFVVGLVSLYAMYTDIQFRLITNKTIVVLVGLFAPFTFINWLGGGIDAYSLIYHLFFAIGLFLFFMVSFPILSYHIGGGDLKFMVASGLWLGPSLNFLSFLLLSLFMAFFLLVFIYCVWFVVSLFVKSGRFVVFFTKITKGFPLGVTLAPAFVYVLVGVFLSTI